MKPNFALTLSVEGIALLHRVPAGWNLVGTVQFDHPDLSGLLAALRADALRLEPEGLSTKLILPNDQIKYLSVSLNGASPTDYRAMAEQALDGTTPYSLSDLAIDVAASDGQLYMAAVAKETLSEAEAFAHEHEFNPVSFVAMPETGAFAGEPFFGGTHAATELFGGPVTPDEVMVEVIGTATIPADPPSPIPSDPDLVADGPSAPMIEEIGVPSFDILENPDGPPVEDLLPPAPPPAPDPTPKSEPEPPQDPPAEPEDYEQAARAAEDELGPAIPLSEEELELLKAAEAAAQAEPAPADSELPAEPAAAPAAEAPPAPLAFSSSRSAEAEAPNAAPPLNGARRTDDGSGVESVRRLSLTPEPVNSETPVDPAPVEITDGDAEAAMLTAGGSLRPTDPQVPERGARNGLLSRRRDRNADAVPDTAAAASPAEITPPPALGDFATGFAEPTEERQRMTVFGARNDTEQRIGGKPKYLGLVLTALLLVMLVFVAAWASFTDDGLAGLFGSDTSVTTAEILAEDQATAEELAEIGGPATADTEPPAEDAVAVVLPQTVEQTLQDLAAQDGVETNDDPQGLALLASPPTQQQTEQRYATTGIWQMAPDQPEVPGESSLDDFYVASIDPDVGALDAVALPAPGQQLNDIPPEALSDPVSADTRFDFDERGFVVATPDGAVTPEGALVYSGSPPVAPPKWPEREQEDSQLDIAPAETTRLAAVRPKPRPGDLVEQNERSQFGGRSRVELAALRPKLRPESAQSAAAAVAESQATEHAVAQSLKPKDRPSDFAAIVERATQQTETQLATGSIFQPQTQPQKTPASQTYKPNLPSTASVARQATVKNQLNLRKINLIGVYGQANNRRALVRMANGRYKKVQVGDRIDGGKIAAIGEGELRYVKAGRSVTLKMPKG